MKSGKILTMIIAFSLILISYQSFAQTAEELLPKAIQLEEVKGELEQAIEVYQTIVQDFPENKSIAAKAQFHIGLCYEKLGLKQAQKAYQQVLDNYPDQQGEVAMAKERLANLQRTQTDLNHVPTFRKIEIASKPQNGVLSPDGNKLAFFSDGAVWIIPLHGKVNPDIAGEPILLAKIPGGWDNGSLMSWSSNGEWIAVNSVVDDEDAAYIIPVAGGEPHRVEMPLRGDYAVSYRLSLSHDGLILAFSANELGKTESTPFDRYIYTMSTTGGKPKQVSSGQGRMPSFSPDGQFIAYVGYSKANDLPKEDDWPNGDLWIVSSIDGDPVRLTNIDGILRGPVWSPDSKYIAANLQPGTTISSTEIIVYPLSQDLSSTSEPIKIQLPRESFNMLAGWTPNDELGAFIQTEQRSAIYTVTVSGGKAVQVSPDGYEPNYPRWSPDGKHIYFRGWIKEDQSSKLFFVPATGGNNVEVQMQSEEEIHSCVPGGGLNISPDGKKIVISTGTMGHEPDESNLFTIPLDGGIPIRLSNDKPIDGYYPCWSPDGRWIAYIEHTQAKADNESFHAIYIIPSEGGKIRQITFAADSVGRGGIAFSPDGKNIAFFSGSAIKTISVKGGQPEVLVADISFDMWSQLAYSPDGKKIAHCAGGRNIWITSLDDGNPQILQTGLPKNARQRELSWSPDSKKIAFINDIGGGSEFWLISDFLPKEATDTK